MDENLIWGLIILVIIYFIYTYKSKPKSLTAEVPLASTPASSVTPVEQFDSWDDVVQSKSIDKGVIASHAEYVDSVRNYASGPAFPQISNDNTNPINTNFTGFSRPEYIPVGTTARQVPDFDIEVLKNNFNPLNNYKF